MFKKMFCMNQHSFFVEENLLPSRIDKIITQLSGFSRSKIQQAIEQGNVSFNDNVITTASFKILSPGNIKINIDITSEPHDIVATKMDINIIYEDNELMVINKPAGLTVHPGHGNYDDTLVNALIYHFGNNLSTINGATRPGIVHRLDRNTTGLIVVAKNDIAHNKLAEQIAEKSAKRTYLTIVWGMLKQNAGIIDTKIGRNPSDRTKMKVLGSGGRQAITEYEVKEILANGIFSLVECKLKTGRTHQIRVHMSHLSNSILGDQTYGANERKIKQLVDKELANRLEQFNRQALHAYKLSFNHPVSGNLMEFTAPMPSDMESLYDYLVTFSKK